MIPTSEYLPKQFNGPVLSAYAEALKQEIDKTAFVIDYLKNLSIDTANETEAENIGRIVGYLRPIVPVGFDEENILLLGILPLQVDHEIGLSTINSEEGGQLSTVEISETNYMALHTYKRLLPKMAIIKRYGLTLESVDKIAKEISNDYSIEFDENADIVLTFEASVGYKNVWLLTQLFNRFATEPQVTIISGD